MIVRCPECSTGFKLPDDKVTDKGVKLRCSKCSHVFRIRQGEDGETEIFYNDSDREQNEQLAASEEQSEDGEDHVDEAAGNKTQLGMPAATTKPMKARGADEDDEGSSARRRTSKSASAGYNPFPHANLGTTTSEDAAEDDEAAPAETDDAQPAAESAQAEQPAESAAPADAPQADAPAEAAASTESAPQEQQEPQPEEQPEAEAVTQAPPAAQNRPPAAAAQPPQTTAAPSQAQAPAKTTAPAGAAAAASTATAEKMPTDDDAGFWAQKDGQYDADEMVDPSFGQDGPVFDPDQGVVSDGPAAEASSGATQSAPAGHPGPARPAEPQRSQQAAGNAAGAPRAAQAPQPQKPSGGGGGGGGGAWEVDDIDDPIAPHTVGGSGFQKVANFSLILLLVGLGFLGLVAALSGWVLDLKRFPHMLEVAFEGAEFEPRSDWTSASAAPVAAPAPEDPVRFEGVFATPVQINDEDKVVLMRGKAQNVTATPFNDVVVRGILYDKNERVIAQTTAPLGGRVLQTAIAEQNSAAEAESLLPESAARLAGNSTESFSLIFTDVPAKFFESPDVSYRVEIAKSEPAGGEATATATNK